MIKIRKGIKSDLPFILDLIKELADYEKALSEVDINLTQLENDGFGNKSVFSFIVAERNNQIVGMALYYTKYSTWKGKCLFLEDLIVREKYRKSGIGSKLFNEVIRTAKSKKMKRVMWQVLDWNQPAINFYKKYNAHIDNKWLDGKLIQTQIDSFTV
tara:strand:+ start:265 stop:735 length:471 start_codon:yes stop_codon:yes gene_type:complete